MALRGNLKDFSLPDVFQLVTFSRKTGVLRINKADGAQGSVWFREGDVFFAQSNWHTEPLGERLVRAQRITPQALAKALEIRASEGEDGRRLGQILVDEGYITDKVLEAFVSEQIQETIFDLMRWDDGEFDFEAMPEAVEEDIGLSVSIENVIMEGSRRLEEWNRIKKKIPSMDVVFKMATAPGEGTFEISLKPIEWNLLLLVDGTRSVAEMAQDTNRTDFEVARIVYGLFSAGLLEFASDEEIERLRAERAEREAVLAKTRAEQAAADRAAQAESLAREAALEADAEIRASEQSALAAAARLAAEPIEEPGFLGGPVSAPTAADAAVLEEMMGAVLEAPKPQPTVEQQPKPAPYVPGEEPAFMTAPQSVDFDLPLVPVPSVEDLLSDIPDLAAEPESVDQALEAVAEVATAELSLESETEPVAQAEADVPLVPESQPMPDLEFEVVSDEAPEAEPEPLEAAWQQPAVPAPPLDTPEAEVEVAAEQPLEVLDIESFEVPAEPASETFGAQVPAVLPDFDLPFVRVPSVETDAGEGPQAARESEPAVAPAPVDLDLPAVSESPTPAEPESDAAEPVFPQFEATAEPVDFERDLMALGLGELPADLLGGPTESGAEQAVVADQGAEISVSPAGYEDASTQVVLDEIAELSASLELPAEMPTQAPDVLTPGEEPVDFSELLESLDVGPEAVEEPVVADAAAEPILPDFDEELLREVAPAGEAGGVISTDAYLEDITIDEMDFGGGMTDELSALTGMGRPSRPTTSVNRIPDAPAEGVLRRDTRVDKDTLLKIIDGIKNL
jgi:hypothetical protein